MADSQPVREEDLPAEDAEQTKDEIEITEEGLNKANSDVEVGSGNDSAVGANEAENVTPSQEIGEDGDTVDDKRSPENSHVVEDASEEENVTKISERGEEEVVLGDNSPENNQLLPEGSEQAALSTEPVRSDQDIEVANEDALKEETTDTKGEPENAEQNNERSTAEIGNDEEVQNPITKTSNEFGSPSTMLTNDPDTVEGAGEPSRNYEPSERDNADAIGQVEESASPELQQASKDMPSPQQSMETEEMQGYEVIEEHKSVVETAVPGDALMEEKASVPQPLVCVEYAVSDMYVCVMTLVVKLKLSCLS